MAESHVNSGLHTVYTYRKVDKVTEKRAEKALIMK